MTTRRTRSQTHSPTGSWRRLGAAKSKHGRSSGRCATGRRRRPSTAGSSQGRSLCPPNLRAHPARIVTSDIAKYATPSAARTCHHAASVTQPTCPSTAGPSPATSPSSLVSSSLTSRYSLPSTQDYCPGQDHAKHSTRSLRSSASKILDSKSLKNKAALPHVVAPMHTLVNAALLRCRVHSSEWLSFKKKEEDWATDQHPVHGTVVVKKNKKAGKKASYDDNGAYDYDL
ncbi:hypothetical protein BC828DRAFT_270578 [Blastocladiella britannica]|nr:hypothetical protein BC828DRAFT_270578 [Blastocladiella britannica]